MHIFKKILRGLDLKVGVEKFRGIQSPDILRNLSSSLISPDSDRDRRRKKSKSRHSKSRISVKESGNRSESRKAEPHKACSLPALEAESGKPCCSSARDEASCKPPCSPSDDSRKKSYRSRRERNDSYYKHHSPGPQVSLSWIMDFGMASTHATASWRNYLISMPLIEAGLPNSNMRHGFSL